MNFCTSYILLHAIAVTSLLVPVTEGFVTSASSPSSSLHRSAPSFLLSSKGNLGDLEEARKYFESSIQPLILGSTIASSTTDATAYTPPPQTASSRRRRLVEIDLLSSLNDSDSAVDKLMMMWMVERGDVTSAQRLRDMEQLCSNGLVVEEAALRDMISDYGMDWPEPMSRLAAVLYYKGNSEESMIWANRVLQVKPWHFEAVQLQLLNCLRLRQDEEDLQLGGDGVEIWKFARQALPPLNPATNHAARRKWTDRALTEARRSFNQAEAQLHQMLTITHDERKEDEQRVWQ